MSKIILAEQGSAPDTPGSGKSVIYVNGNGELAVKDDAGNVTTIGRSAILTAAGIKPANDGTSAIQLQKANGTAVLTVDTTNSKVTASDGTNSVVLNNAGAESFALGVQHSFTALRTTRITLADDESHTIGAVYGFLFCSTSTNTIGALWFLRSNATYLLLDASNSCANSDTDGKLCCYHNGTNIVLRNRLGASSAFFCWMLKQ